MLHGVLFCRHCFLSEICFIFLLKVDAPLVFHLTAGHCYTWQMSPFPEVLQALVLGSVESSPASVKLFRAGFIFFFFFLFHNLNSEANALFFQVRLKRISKY